MSKRPSAIYNDPGYLYRPHVLRRLFTISAAALMVGILWWIWQDFDRPWKEEQRREMQWEARKLALEAMLLERRSQDVRAELGTRKAAADGKIAAQEKEIAEKENELKTAKGAFYAADLAYKEQKQYTIEAEYWIHEAKTAAERDAWRKRYREAKDEEDRLRDAYQYADARLQALLAERQKLEEELDQVVADERKNPDLKRLEIVLANIRKKKGYNPAREIPLLDFLAPPTKVEQIVLDNLIDNYEFSTPKKVDRCGTCHILATNVGNGAEKWPVEVLPGGARQGDARAFEEGVYRFVYDVLESVWPERVPRDDPYQHEKALNRKVDIHHATLHLLFEEYDEDSGEIGLDKQDQKVWRKFKRDGDRWVESADGHSIAEYYVRILERLQGNGHWRTHPHFDDMVGAASPHPYEKFGCTTCHQGRGWSVDFGLAFHTPDRVRVDDWMTEERAHEEGHHLPLSAGQTLEEAMAKGAPAGAPLHTGWVTDEETGHRWEEQLGWTESKRHYWHWPQFPKSLVQASCLKCHREGLYERAEEEYGNVRLGKPDPNVPDIFNWEDHSLAFNPDLADAPNRLLIPDDAGKEPYRPEELERGLDDFLRFGCYGCHKLDATVFPFMANVRPKVGPPLDEFAAKASKEWALKWVRNPKDYRDDTRMPRFWGLANNSHDFRYRFADGFGDVDGGAWADAEIYSIVEWIFEESRGRARALPAVDLAKGDPVRGERLVVGDGPTTGNLARGCTGCHDVEVKTEELRYDAAKLAEAKDPATRQETGWKLRMGRRQGPDLAGIGSKVRPEWLFTWLKNPRDYWHDTNMPDLRLTDQEALDITAYLMTLKQAEFDGLPGVPHHQPVIDAIARELRVSEQRESTQAAVNAVDRLSPHERTLYVGRQLFKHYGCFGCHTVEEYKTATPIGTELTEWGSKLIDRLEFNHAPIEHTRFDFAYAKMMNPRIYDFGMPRRDKPFERLKMPRFGFTPGEARDLATFLVGLVSDPVPEASLFQPDERQKDIIRGREIVKRYNCQACHLIEEEGGDLWPVITDVRWRPPDLLGQGRKTNPAWLFQFLKDPAFVTIPGQEGSDRVRPWHSIRMPTFHLSDEEARSLVRYFAALSRAPADFETPPPDSLTGPEARYADAKTLQLSDPQDRSRKMRFVANNRLEEARGLFQEYQCKSCHSTESPPANAAPDFRHTRAGRLREDWIVTWLWAPLKLQPGTAMPMFFPNATTSQDAQFFAGSPDEQIRALRDFIRHHYREEDR